ncbi:MAG: ABC transporter ATP-binding protein [Terrisporobacter sp.]|uniref:ABC transporter ATP-binding protein n=1 Tax=Terrisporobacter sp. TaxID=1965305 RepID=UPI002FC798B9
MKKTNFITHILKIKTIYSRVFSFIKDSDSKNLFIVATISLILGLIPGISVILMQKIINSVQNYQISFLDTMILVMIYIAQDIFSELLIRYKAYKSFILQSKLILKIDLSILNKTRDLDLEDFEDTEVYNMIQRAQEQSSSEVFTYFMSMLSIFQSLINIFTNIVIISAWNIWIIPVIMLLSLVKSIYLIFFSKKQYNIIKKRTGKSRKKWYYQYLLTNDIAFKEIKMYSLSNYFIDRYKELYNEFLKQDTSLNKELNIVDSIIAFFDCFVVGIIFTFIIWSTKTSKILIGDAIAYIRSMSNIKGGLESFVGQIVSISKDTLYIEQLFEFLDLDTQKNVNHSAEKVINDIISIELINVSYKYKSSDKYALKNINLKLQKNDLCAIVGENGSGKSTLIKLIAGYYDNYEGDILINNISLKEINKNNLRNNIGILFQDYTRYELTVRENVAIGNLKKFNEDYFIKELLLSVSAPKNIAENLDTQLGYWFDDGVQLSGGEWMKIALARAFMRNSSLYILDEPNASLDAIAEKNIFSQFEKLASQKIGLLITHRYSSSKNITNKIILMDNGKIEDVGTHEELYMRSSKYRKLCVSLD